MHFRTSALLFLVRLLTAAASDQHAACSVDCRPTVTATATGEYLHTVYVTVPPGEYHPTTSRDVCAPKSTDHGVCYFAPILTQSCVWNTASGQQEVATTISIGEMLNSTHETILRQPPMLLRNSPWTPTSIPPAEGALKNWFLMYWLKDEGEGQKKGQSAFRPSAQCVFRADEANECGGCGWMGWMQPELDCGKDPKEHRSTPMSCFFAC
ncbi:hypothetical protein K458DRAFT_146143 [Lentithecium fluviatile CBS 122367]|uniref:Lytic polysaccharide monooxygenase n=1 Tax=Lentithecium fluviatile CBS 122367 TaxID=1168545 RepID=A0A6G1JCJ0_9PLEO|nr:hypothetical protein K458DRAFT_146143 [Lentithecium fluviatile CBS 122367]